MVRYVGLTNLSEYQNQVPKKAYIFVGRGNMSSGAKVGRVSKSVRVSKPEPGGVKVRRVDKFVGVSKSGFQKRIYFRGAG